MNQERTDEVPILNCGAYADIEHHMHMWCWRSAVIPPDLTYETTAYRYCPGVLRRHIDVIRAGSSVDDLAVGGVTA